MKPLYTTKATVTGGRDGKAESADGLLSVALATPKELGGKGGATNPEQLFAAGYAACYLSAMRFVGGRDKIAVPADTTVVAEVGVGQRDDGQGFGIAVTLSVSLPGVDTAVAEDLMARTHIVCPYSHATRGNIPLTTTLV